VVLQSDRSPEEMLGEGQAFDAPDRRDAPPGRRRGGARPRGGGSTRGHRCCSIAVLSHPTAHGSGSTWCYLLYECRIRPGELHLNAELTEAAWADPRRLDGFDLNPFTVETFRSLGWLSG
jgi:hypothetical protein